MSNHQNRETWLKAAIGLMTATFEQAGYTVPSIRVACGWPVRGGLAKKKRVLGECWSKDASADGQQAQIFISPALCDDGTDPIGVLPTLVHEVVHAVVGHKEAHNKVFGKCARAVGLEGKLTATNAGPELLDKCKSWYAALGAYPHSQLHGLEKEKKQSTRLLKALCIHEHGEDTCGYTVRVTKKWVDEVGAPHCPVHGQMEVEAKKEEEGDDDE
jgi:hypothetical protein